MSTALFMTCFAALVSAEVTLAEVVVDGALLDEVSTVATLPTLGNTSAGDRPLLEEIGDDHVHSAEPGAGEVQVGFMTGDVSMSDDAWERIRDSRRIDIPSNERVREQTLVVRHELLWISKILHRGTPYLGHLVAELDARYLPVELALLPAVESGFRPHARSDNEAAGLWQFVPETADEIGIDRNDWYDGRADIVISTTAAIDYLGYLNATFHGDWELTLAAYNAGLGRVRKAIKRNLAAGLPTDYWSLRLPTETREYVPKLYALIQLLRDGGATVLELPPVSLESAFAKVDVGRRMSIERASNIGRVPISTLRQLNAALLHDVTPPAGPHALYVPRASADAFLRRLGQAYAVSLHALPDTYVVVTGDTLSAIARKYDVGVDAITRADGSALPDDVIRPGDALLVQRLRADSG